MFFFLKKSIQVKWLKRGKHGSTLVVRTLKSDPVLSQIDFLFS